MQVPEPIGITLESLQQQIDDFSVPQATFQNTLNVVRFGSVSVTFPSTDTLPSVREAVVDHNLGYAPSFIAFWVSPDGSSYAALPLAHGYTSNADIAPYSTKTQLLVNIQMFNRQSPGDVTFTIKYYLFREPATTTTG